MTEMEYKQKASDIEKNYIQQKQSLRKKYALFNARFNKGDIIKDSSSTIEIDTISYSYFNTGPPVTIYFGYELKKDLTRREDNSRGCVYESSAELITPSPAK